MPVPERCEDAEKKFQDEVNTFPDLPANMLATIGGEEGEDGGLLWSQAKKDITDLIQSSHIDHIENFNTPDTDWTLIPNNMYMIVLKEFTEFLGFLVPNYDLNHPFTQVVKQYALRVKNADKDVINCIKNAPIVTKKVKRSKMGWDDPITSKRMKNGDRVFRLDGKDTMIFLADPNGLTQWLTTRNINPLTNQAPTSKEEFIVDIEEDAGEPPAEGGRRKTRKYKRRAKKTRRRHK